jgi:hypothetical protein
MTLNDRYAASSHREDRQLESIYERQVVAPVFRLCSVRSGRHKGQPPTITGSLPDQTRHHEHEPSSRVAVPTTLRSTKVGRSGRVHVVVGRGAVMAQKDRAWLEPFWVVCALTGRSGVIRDRGGHVAYERSDHIVA